MNKLLLVILSTIVTYFIYTKFIKSTFSDKLINTNLNPTQQPMNFPPVDPSTVVPGFPALVPPVVPEEIGLTMVYPQGAGAAMSKMDSNSFDPGNPGPLLTDYTVPQSYGESNLTDPYGTNGADQGARILKIGTTGDSMKYKPMDESEKEFFSAAYTPGEVSEGLQLINDSQSINYNDSYNPSNSLVLQASPGQMSTLSNCETTYPNTVKYNNFCITEGDIPYGQVVDNKVNPRLVSRWESFTGDYPREAALTPIDGLLYPTLSVLAEPSVA
jgi:hypothetical protein